MLVVVLVVDDVVFSMGIHPIERHRIHRNHLEQLVGSRLLSLERSYRHSWLERHRSRLQLLLDRRIRMASQRRLRSRLVIVDNMG